RLVELRDLDQAPTEVFEALVAYCGSPSPGSVLVAVGVGFPKVEKGGSNWAARVKSAIKGKGLIVTFGADAVPAGRFAIDVAARAGKTLTAGDAERLVAVVGGDLGRIEQEVGKLCTFVGDAPTIDAAAIDAAGSVVAEAVIWDLTAALAARDPAVALESLYRLQESGEDARKLLGMILWQMRELLRVAELVARGVSDRDITARVRIRFDLLRKVRPTMANGFPHAADLLRRLATANRQMNSHRAGADRILEGLVLEMLDGRLHRPPPVPRPR
ncbi:MAG: DNA polymerase III subunit delta, partial [Myxococcota bacterium]